MNAHAPAPSEAVVETLTRDYLTYHLVFVVGGVLVIIAALVLAAVGVRELARSRRARSDHGLRFARLSYAAFATVGLLTAAGMTILVLANLGNALSPAAGFADAIEAVSDQTVSSSRSDVRQAGAAWLNSGDEAMPATLKRAIDERLSWQAPKAVVSLIALAAAVVFSVLWWRRLIERSRRAQPASGISWKASVAIGWFMMPACFALMVLSLVNAQASIAPIVLTLTMS
jgi:hypothetical protein